MRYAYPLEFFMLKAPEFDRTPLAPEAAQQVRNSFLCGIADHIPARALVRAGIAQHYAMRGGIFWRREPVKYVVVHSTETGIPLNAKRVIDSWSSMGRRHPGAQYVVERDGTIYQAVDPDLGTVHLNIFKTLPGINNDNSIGIEMVHTGRQTYTAEQRASVIRLVHYLQDRYHVSDDNVITHRYAQQGDHTDPVGFDWDGFLKEKTRFRTLAFAARLQKMSDDAEKWWRGESPVASTYLQIHGQLRAPDRAPSGTGAAQAAELTPATAPQSLPPRSDNSVPPAAIAAGAPESVSDIPASTLEQPALRGPIEIDARAAGMLLGQPASGRSGGTPAPAAGQTEAAEAARPEREPEPSGSKIDYFIHQPLQSGVR
ncbi:MAG TPA: peptidoglycan recognition family protein [Candidatus Obscuribacterales bacterium]